MVGEDIVRAAPTFTGPLLRSSTLATKSSKVNCGNSWSAHCTYLFIMRLKLYI